MASPFAASLHTSMPRTLLDLPDELLLDIFTAVKVYKPGNKSAHQDFSSSSADIAAVRLVCRRLNSISSPFLVHYIRLKGRDPRSLQRLEAISQHNLLRKGVKIVRFEACGYVPTLANDVAKFARWAGGRVLERTDSYSQAFLRELKTETQKKDCDVDELIRKHDEVTEVRKRVKAVLETWNSVISPIEDKDILFYEHEILKTSGKWHSTPDVKSHDKKQHHIELLHAAHSLYRQRLEEQEKLSQDVFLARFKKAISRMPRALHLEIQDLHHEPKTCLEATCCKNGGNIARVQDSDQFAGLLDIGFLAEPTSRTDMEDDPMGNELGGLGLTLPIVLQNAGCRLDCISVRTNADADDYYSLIRKTFSSGGFSVLNDAISAVGLKSFTFLHRFELMSAHGTSPSRQDMEAFGNYIGTMTNSSRLERLRIQLHSGSTDASPPQYHGLSIGRVVLSSVFQSRRTIKDVHLTNLPVYILELKEFSQALEDHSINLDYFTLERLKLFEGTWPEVLKVLREMRNVRDKQILETHGVFYGSTWPCFGKEIADLEIKANQFINGGLEHNPLPWQEIVA